jgi:hypothetical protein
MMRIREGKKFGSGMENIRIRDKHPGSATLVSNPIFLFFKDPDPESLTYNRYRYWYW